MRKFLTICVLAITSQLFSQNNIIDSLKQKIDQTKGTEKALAINLLAKTYLDKGDSEEGFEFAKNALTYSEKIKFVYGEVLAMNTMGCYYRNTNNGEQALTILSQALEKSKEIDSLKIQSNTLCSIGSVYIRLSQYDKALQYFEQAYPLAEKSKDDRLIGKSLNFIGQVYFFKGDYSKSLDNFLKAMVSFETASDRRLIAQNAASIANVYLVTNQNSSAKKYLEKALEINCELGNKNGMATNYSYLADIYWNEKKYSEAQVYYNKALQLCEELGDKYFLSTLNNNIGENYYKLGRYTKAEEFFTRAKLLSDEINDQEGIIYASMNLGKTSAELHDYNKATLLISSSLRKAKEFSLLRPMKGAYEMLSKIYTYKNDFERAFKNYKLFTQIKDSILNIDIANQLSELQVKYDTEKKDQQIKLQEVTLKNKSLILQYSLAGGSLALVALVLIIILYRKKNQAYKQLVYQNLSALNKQHILYEVDLIDDNGNENSNTENHNYPILDEHHKQPIIECLNQLIENKVYLESELTINKLAERCDTNRTYLSIVINEEYHTNFNTFINKLRIEEAKGILSVSSNGNIPLKELYQRLGFTSYSTFHEAFKKHIGVTPAYYQNTVKKLLKVSNFNSIQV
ncbi:MAG: helix-turn-helix domain-containing protein [Bacteroidales bacterium]|nr:MAG: helix-turn-helix domain-containing protein [Bacteroidales bacterium]